MSLPDEVSRTAAVAFLGDVFDVDPGQLAGVEFAPNSFPAATVVVTDMTVPVRLCEALEIDPDGLGEGMRVAPAGVTVTLPDGEERTIPFDSEEVTS